MAAFLALIIIIIIAVIVQKNRERSDENIILEIRKKQIVDMEKSNQEKVFILNRIVKDRICKYQNRVCFVITDEKLLRLIWSEDGEDLYHYIIQDLIYKDIEIEENIEKSNKEYIMLNDIKNLLVNLYDTIIPDIDKLNESISQTQKSINIAKSIENGTHYIQLMNKYLFTMKTLLHKAEEIQTKYNKFIKEIYAQYELEKFESTMNISIIDKNIDYKNIEDNLISQYKEYSNYRNVYEELSRELKETL